MKISKVKLRQKTLKDGKRASLYLDFYPAIQHPHSGKLTRREFLGMYIVLSPKDELEKTQNKNISLRARMICADRQNMIYNNDYGFLASELENQDFLAYFKELAVKRHRSASNQAVWLIVHKYLSEFSSEIKMKDLTIRFVHEFRDSLLYKTHKRKKSETISQNTASSYFAKFIYAIKCAYKDNLIKDNLAPKIERIKGLETKRQFLTREEATLLKNTPCKDKILKQVCLFMIYTGLRISDVQKLTWTDIEFSENTGYYIRFRHKKTGNQQTQPISKEAYDLMPSITECSDLVFARFKRDYNKLKEWISHSGINKNVGFHTFRHTYATMLLNSDVSIFTVKEMLGHKDLKTTMNYVNLLDEKKIEAASRIQF